MKFLSKDSRRSPLDCLNSLVDTKLGIYLKQQMYMVWHDFHFEQIDLDVLARFTDQLLQSRVNAIDQNFPAILGAENDVILARIRDVVI